MQTAHLRRLRRATIGVPLVGPTNTVPPAITGTPTVGETLSCSTGTWTGNGTITYTRQWNRSGTSISGATGATYDQALADQGFSVGCTVTATDDDGSTAANATGAAMVSARHVTFDSTTETFDATTWTFDEAAA